VNDKKTQLVLIGPKTTITGTIDIKGGWRYWVGYSGFVKGTKK